MGLLRPPSTGSSSGYSQQLPSIPTRLHMDMATSTPLKAIRDKGRTLGSTQKLIPSFPKHVSLYDWWLIKVDTPSNGRVLGVGGLSSKEQLGVRVLHSDAIVKRHNTNTVETADGLTITFSGSINKLRTVLNGFPREVCDQFIFGFPHCWKDLCTGSFAKEASSSAVNNSADAANNFISKSFDDLPIALARDLFVSKIEGSGSRKLRSIFGDILQTYGVDPLNQHSELISPSEKSTLVIGDSAEDETRSGHKKMKEKQKQKDNNDTADAKHRKKFQKVTCESGLSRRNAGHMEVARDEQDQDILLRSLKNCHLVKSSSLSNAPIKRHGGLITRRNESSLSSTTRTLSLRNRSIDFHIT